MVNLLYRFANNAPRPPVGQALSLRARDDMGAFDSAPVTLTDPDQYLWGNGYTLISIGQPLDACLIIEGWRYVETKGNPHDNQD